MESVNFTSSVSAQQEASHNEELFMQQRLLFSDSLKVVYSSYDLNLN